MKGQRESVDSDQELAYSHSRLQLNSGEMKLVVVNGREYIGREGD